MIKQHINWLLDSKTFPDERLKKSLENNSISYKEIHPGETLFRHDIDLYKLSGFRNYECVIFHGSLYLSKLVQDNTAWFPGAYYHPHRYNFSEYRRYYNDYLLNNRCLVLSIECLEEYKDFYLDKFSVDDTIFIRPDCGNKKFTGQLVSSNNLPAFLEFVKYYGCDNDTLVVISSPQNIILESRFIICNKKVICGSIYKSNGELIEDDNYIMSDKEFVDFNNSQSYLGKILEGVDYHPDIAYVADVCVLDNLDIKLIELNSFSSSGFYNCDRDIIVREVSKTSLLYYYGCIQKYMV